MTTVAPIPRAPGKRMDPASLDAAGAGVGAIRVVLASLSGVACLAALQALAQPRWPEAAPLAAPAVVAS
jgi:hypothetical protein